MDDPGFPLPETPDDQLVRSICSGDEGALSVLYRRYVTSVYRFILAQVRDVQDAEDLTSETFARMMRGIGGYRGEASFRNWLYQIARNAVRNHRRAARYRLALPLPHSVAEPSESDTEQGERQEHEVVLRLLQPLPPRYRQVLELRFLEDCTIEETARRMGITIGNAKVIQHRALKKAAAVHEEVPAERG